MASFVPLYLADWRAEAADHPIKSQDARRKIPWETIHGIGGDEMRIGLEENRRNTRR